ncbi:hypothetical protein GE300_04480 [Rhodobacteraceae bacterium 2CG4]|uniref:Uncharacterized protein n=1 Tax=Halovulum marinum TaxID=2662447 RepID=A0A6L5YY06_9RHOB|nr:hypothetical protein [Halovulum marinum]MSU88879.1 hypothetical protein [Halovulum marinum]
MTGSSTEFDMDRTAEDARSAARDLKDEAAGRLAQARDAAVDSAASGAETAKNRTADEVSSVATALRRASDELRQGSPQERTFGQIAESLAELSDGIRDKDLRDLVHDASAIARRNPLAFLGGAALLGFAATRFAKAGQRGQAFGSGTGQGSAYGAGGYGTGAGGYGTTTGDGYRPDISERAEAAMPPRSAAPATAYPAPAVKPSEDS